MFQCIRTTHAALSRGIPGEVTHTEDLVAYLLLLLSMLMTRVKLVFVEVFDLLFLMEAMVQKYII